ncbi:MAG: Cys-Gln thioester bond-forming surface protein [Phycisphaerales bacterium]
MFRQTSIAIAATAAISVSASAGSIDMEYTGVAGNNSATTARVGSSTYYAGHMMHTITSGPRMGESFASFCIEIGENANNGSSTYQIIDLADAPQPGSPYGQAKADAVSAVVANAVAMGWIDSNLQADSNQADYLAKMGAIQAAIWEALGHNFQLTAGGTSNSLEVQYGLLMNTDENDGRTFDSSMRLQGLRALVATGEQDMLYVVPLPPAAFAGLGLLGGIAGVRTIRRR